VRWRAAIPVDTVRRVVNQIIRHGRVPRPTLGIQVADDQILRDLSRRVGRELPGVRSQHARGHASLCAAFTSISDRWPHQRCEGRGEGGRSTRSNASGGLRVTGFINTSTIVNHTNDCGGLPLQVLVMSVAEGTPASRAGIRATLRGQGGVVIGDIVQSVAGHPTRQVEELLSVVESQVRPPSLPLLHAQVGTTYEYLVSPLCASCSVWAMSWRWRCYVALAGTHTHRTCACSSLSDVK
jgi:hypothetical protein